jgi:hypothetical protein
MLVLMIGVLVMNINSHRPIGDLLASIQAVLIPNQGT